MLLQIYIIRSEINKSTKSNIELSVQYGVSEKTIVKWKAREKYWTQLFLKKNQKNLNKKYYV